MDPRQFLQHQFLFLIFCCKLTHLLVVVSYLEHKKNNQKTTEEWDALHPWFLGCRRTVRFTHELQELWITSLDPWNGMVEWRLGCYGMGWKGLEGQEIMEQKNAGSCNLWIYEFDYDIIWDIFYNL